MAYKAPATSNTVHGVAQTDTYDFVATNGIVKQREGVKTYFVGKHGNDSADGLTFSSAKLTIQAAVTAAGSDAAVYVYPGSYVETVTHAANNVSVYGMGFRGNVILTQADANVLSIGASTSIVYQDITIQCTAATTAINTVQVTSGSLALRQCSTRMVCAANIAAAAQPTVARITANGSIEFRRGIIEYFNTGNGGATAIKTALRLGAANCTFNLLSVRQITVTNSGTALVSSVCYDESNNGTFRINDSTVNVTDTAATSVIGLAYISNAASTNLFSKNIITVVGGGANACYGVYAADNGSTTRMSHNKISVTGGATNYSYFVGAAATVNVVWDDVTAASGKTGTGTFVCTYSPSTGTEIISTGLILQPSTAHAPLLGQGASAVTSMAVGGTGQTIIGVSGADPVWGSPPATSGAPVTNIGLTYAGGTLTLTSASAAALSATNVGYATLPGKTAGVIKTISITADQSTTDGAAGAMDNTRFGLVTGVSWGNDLPLFLYLVLNDAENAVCAMLSRNPAATVAPAAASIGKSGSIVNVGQGDFFAFGNPTVADYEGNPCICIGAVRAQFAGATDSYTIQALSSADGVGRWHENTVFVQGAGTNGCASGKMFYATGGTQPAFEYQYVRYCIQRTGFVDIEWYSSNLNVNGVGAYLLKPILPLNPVYEGYSWGMYNAYAGGAHKFYAIHANSLGNQIYLDNVVLDTYPQASVCINTSFASGDSLVFPFRYQAF